MRSRSSSRRRRRWRTFCASAWSFQKSGDAARASSLVSSSAGWEASKITSKFGRALHEVLVAACEFVENESHRRSVYRNGGWRPLAESESAGVSYTSTGADRSRARTRRWRSLTWQRRVLERAWKRIQGSGPYERQPRAGSPHTNLRGRPPIADHLATHALNQSNQSERTSEAVCWRGASGSMRNDGWLERRPGLGAQLAPRPLAAVRRERHELTVCDRARRHVGRLAGHDAGAAEGEDDENQIEGCSHGDLLSGDLDPDGRAVRINYRRSLAPARQGAA